MPAQPVHDARLQVALYAETAYYYCINIIAIITIRGMWSLSEFLGAL